MTKLRQTPSQTVGPYFAYGLSPEQYGYQQF
jgi:protocatechuate 3,4-dioxygenase alpha subunit